MMLTASVQATASASVSQRDFISPNRAMMLSISILTFLSRSFILSVYYLDLLSSAFVPLGAALFFLPGAPLGASCFLTRRI
jgi:hypothetical protein